MRNHTALAKGSILCGLSVVTVEAGEGEGAITAFQPANFSHRSGETGAACQAVKGRFGSPDNIACQGVEIGPRPEFPKPSDHGKFIKVSQFAEADYVRVRVERVAHFDPAHAAALLKRSRSQPFASAAFKFATACFQ